MINKYDLIRYSKNADNCWFRVENEKDVISKETGEIVCGIDELTQVCREKMHCDFECVYSEHASLQVIYRCKQCGTVIFASDDEHYDPNLRCPNCGEYKTWFEYWTAEEIAEDEEKQKAIEFYEHAQKELIEQNKRYLARGRKYDWEIGEYTIRGKKRGVKFKLECDNLFETKLKGLRLKISWLKRDDDGVGFIYTKHWRIPLSFSALKRMWSVHKYKKTKDI